MTDEQRLDKLEKLFTNFKLVGDGVEVAGELSKGYTSNCPTCPETGDGGGTPVVGACCFEDGSCVEETLGECLLDGGIWQPGTCDPNPCVGCPETLNVTIADLDMDCGCVCNDEVCDEGSISFQYDGVSVNGSFEVTKITDEENFCLWFGQSGDIRVRRWLNPDCSGDPANDSTGTTNIFVAKYFGRWYFFNDLGDLNLGFFSSSATFGAVMNNEVECGPYRSYYPADPNNFWDFWDGRPYTPRSHNGTAVLSIP